MKNLVAATALLLTISSECMALACNEDKKILYAPGQFTTDRNYAGRLAWRPEGDRSPWLRVIDECATLSKPKNGKLELIISGVTTPRSAAEKYGFVLVQIVRIQKNDQVDRITVTRKGSWRRDQRDLEELDDDEIDIEPTEFFNIHLNMSLQSPNDAKLAVEGQQFHGMPVDGLYSSLTIGRELADDRVVDLMKNKASKLSSRLYRFEVTQSGRIGVPFFTRLDGTSRLLIRTYSPHRPEFDRVVQIDLM